jgi:hypothetical protein
MDAVKSGHLSIRKAAIEFDVPKTTLHDTLKEKYQDAGMPGLKPTLPVNIENRIANALKEATAFINAERSYVFFFFLMYFLGIL